MKLASKSRFVIALCVLFLLITVVNVSAAGAQDGDENAVTIAYLTPSTTVPFWNWVEDGVQDGCDSNGWNLITYDSKDDAAIQLSNAQNAITRQVDAIVISPCDSVSCAAVLDEAEMAGVPVVICDIGTESGTFLSFVSTPNYDGAYEVGSFMADYILSNDLPKGPIGEITVPFPVLMDRIVRMVSEKPWVKPASR